MRREVVSGMAGNNRNVRLGLGLRVERHRSLDANLPGGSQIPSKDVRDQGDHRRVPSALWLGEDELPAQEL
jgi:hypothetical protein